MKINIAEKGDLIGTLIIDQLMKGILIKIDKVLSSKDEEKLIDSKN